MLSLHLFAVLHRLKAEGAPALGLAQELTDRFSADMETVLREIGIGDITIPKKMRRLAASSGALMQAYEEALAGGEDAIAAALVRHGSARATTAVRGCKPASRPLSN